MALGTCEQDLALFVFHFECLLSELSLILACVTVELLSSSSFADDVVYHPYNHKDGCVIYYSEYRIFRRYHGDYCKRHFSGNSHFVLVTLDKSQSTVVLSA